MSRAFAFHATTLGLILSILVPWDHWEWFQCIARCPPLEKWLCHLFFNLFMFGRATPDCAWGSPDLVLSGGIGVTMQCQGSNKLGPLKTKHAFSLLSIATALCYFFTVLCSFLSYFLIRMFYCPKRTQITWQKHNLVIENMLYIYEALDSITSTKRMPEKICIIWELKHTLNKMLKCILKILFCGW